MLLLQNTLTTLILFPITLKLQDRASMLLQIAGLGAQWYLQATKILQWVPLLWVSLIKWLLPPQPQQWAIKCQSVGSQSRSSKKVTAPSIGKLSQPKKTPQTRARQRILLQPSPKLNRSLRRLPRHLLPPHFKTLAPASLYLQMVHPNLKLQLLQSKLSRACKFHLLFYHLVILQPKESLSNLNLKNLLRLSLWKIKRKDLPRIKLQS